MGGDGRAEDKTGGEERGVVLKKRKALISTRSQTS